MLWARFTLQKSERQDIEKRQGLSSQVPYIINAVDFKG